MRFGTLEEKNWRGIEICYSAVALSMKKLLWDLLFLLWNIVSKWVHTNDLIKPILGRGVSSEKGFKSFSDIRGETSNHWGIVSNKIPSANMYYYKHGDFFFCSQDLANVFQVFLVILCQYFSQLTIFSPKVLIIVIGSTGAQVIKRRKLFCLCTECNIDLNRFLLVCFIFSNFCLPPPQDSI